MSEDREKPVGPGRPAARKEGRTAPESRAGKVDGTDRRAQALRDNLRRRKAQVRARKAGPDGESQSGN